MPGDRDHRQAPFAPGSQDRPASTATDDERRWVRASLLAEGRLPAGALVLGMPQKYLDISRFLETQADDQSSGAEGGTGRLMPAGPSQRAPAATAPRPATIASTRLSQECWYRGVCAQPASTPTSTTDPAPSTRAPGRFRADVRADRRRQPCPRSSSTRGATSTMPPTVSGWETEGIPCIAGGRGTRAYLQAIFQHRQRPSEVGEVEQQGQWAPRQTEHDDLMDGSPRTRRPQGNQRLPSAMITIRPCRSAKCVPSSSQPLPPPATAPAGSITTAKAPTPPGRYPDQRPWPAKRCRDRDRRRPNQVAARRISGWFLPVSK